MGSGLLGPHTPHPRTPNLYRSGVGTGSKHMTLTTSHAHSWVMLRAAEMRRRAPVGRGGREHYLPSGWCDPAVHTLHTTSGVAERPPLLNTVHSRTRFPPLEGKRCCEGVRCSLQIIGVPQPKVHVSLNTPRTR